MTPARLTLLILALAAALLTAHHVAKREAFWGSLPWPSPSDAPNETD